MDLTNSLEPLQPMTRKRLAVLSIIIILLLSVLLLYFGMDQTTSLVSTPDTYFVNPPDNTLDPSPIGGELQTI